MSEFNPSDFPAQSKFENPLVSPEAKIEYLEKFAQGSVFDTDFKEAERQLSSETPTVAFDLDNTLRGWINDPREGWQSFLRDRLKKVLKDLTKTMGYRLVAWSAANRASVGQTLNKYPEFGKYFDKFITAENYSYNFLSDAQKKSLRDNSPDLADYMDRYYINHETDKLIDNKRPAKDIKSLGYKLLVEDDPESLREARDLGFNCLVIPAYDYDEFHGEDKKKQLAHSDIHEEYFAHELEREIKNIVETSGEDAEESLNQLERRYVVHSER